MLNYKRFELQKNENANCENRAREVKPMEREWKRARRLSPKQKRAYVEFLYILPFMLLVAAMSYFPLYGWRYAFHDYEPPFPITPENYVGLKWFNYIIENPVRLADVGRVLVNTFAMSGISLAFSWFPMIFAVFLNEIRCRPYKKFVQTVTTLPNFISWVLVFSVAFNVLSSNGAVNKILAGLGLIDKPIAFLSSKEHVWFRMWLWLTWKNAGWAAIMYLAAISAIDEQMIEAAKVDGASLFTICWKIVMPNQKPALMTMIIFAFQAAWNIQGGTLVYNEALKTLPTVIAQAGSAGLARMGVAAAGSIFMLVPPIVIFMLAQKNVIETMAHSGIKD
jgi:putative aldouronate transport system permease protein